MPPKAMCAKDAVLLMLRRIAKTRRNCLGLPML
jgi:hypothetical protein